MGYASAHNYSGAYYDNQTLYFNWDSINQGTAAASGYRVHVALSGAGTGSWDWTGQSTAAGYSTYLTTDQSFGPLVAGTYTLTVWLDYDGTVSESNEGNNSYSRTFTVTAAAQADLTPSELSN